VVSLPVTCTLSPSKVAFDYALFLDSLTFENGTDKGPETSVTNYKSTLHNIQKGEAFLRVKKLMLVRNSN
jgi:hypothetical protein